MWAGIVSFLKQVWSLLTAIVDMGRKIVTIKPLEFAQKLIDATNPMSTHNTINLIWGVGSFVGFWLDHFWRLHLKETVTFTWVDYAFIGGMAGISTFSAILNNKTGKLVEPQPPEPPANQ